MRPDGSRCIVQPGGSAGGVQAGAAGGAIAAGAGVDTGAGAETIRLVWFAWAVVLVTLVVRPRLLRRSARAGGRADEDVPEKASTFETGGDCADSQKTSLVAGSQ